MPQQILREKFAWELSQVEDGTGRKRLAAGQMLYDTPTDHGFIRVDLIGGVDSDSFAISVCRHDPKPNPAVRWRGL